MTTKCEFRYMKFAASISHGVCSISARWNPGSKNSPSELSMFITWCALTYASMLARVGDPAHDLIALVGEEEEGELEHRVEDAPRQQTVDPRPHPTHRRVIVKGA